MAVDELVQQILDNPNKGEMPCAICDGPTGENGESLGFIPSEYGTAIAHLDCIKDLVEEVKKKKRARQ